MTETVKSNPRKIMIGPFRMSFPNILKPREYNENGVIKRRHELTALCPPTFSTAGALGALRAAMVEKFGEDPTKWPKLKRKSSDAVADFAKYNAEDSNKPLPGDWAGWHMIRTASPEDRPPAVVGPLKGPDGKFPVVTDPREVYGGRWARATVEAYFYDRKDGKGVTFGLVNVQLLKHDAPFGRGVAKAEDDFTDADAEWVGAGNDADWNAGSNGGGEDPF